MRSSAILLASIAYATASTCAVDNAKKVDCGFAGITSDACVAKGCCWSPAGDNSATPWCFNAGEDSGYGYSLDSIAPTEFGFDGVLSKAGPSSSQYGADITNLQLEVHMISADTIRVKIDDVKAGRWQVPQSVIPRHDTGNSAVSQDYEFSFTNSPFTFEVKRKSDGASLFKSSESLLFKDQYIELTTELNSAAKTFGLGESARTNHALKTGRTYTLWAADVAALGKDQNLYSSMPFYVQMLNGKAHGVLLLNR
jgi:alpha-glucosidase (family GH31 glycosyl hydrolase)